MKQGERSSTTFLPEVNMIGWNTGGIKNEAKTLLLLHHITTEWPDTHLMLLTETLLVQRAHPQQAYRTLLGILRLGKSYGEQRLEAACDRALQINALSYRSIESILKNGLDQKPLRSKENNSKPLQHSNIRGADYYDSTIH